jgi:16S rRNA G527 N7-methylase RsmG
MQIVKEEVSKIPDFDLMVDYQSRALANTNDLKDMIENILLQGRLIPFSQHKDKASRSP